METKRTNELLQMTSAQLVMYAQDANAVIRVLKAELAEVKSGTKSAAEDVAQLIRGQVREIERLKAELEATESARRDMMTKWGHAIGEKDALKEELAALKQASEPVAWLGSRLVTCDPALVKREEAKGFVFFPLCRAPQPQAREPVAEVYRHGKDSHGREWHGVHWYDPNLDVPTGTKLYAAPQPQAQDAEIARLKKVMLDAWNDTDWLLIANEVHDLKDAASGETKGGAE